MRLLRTLGLVFALALLAAPIVQGKPRVRIVGGSSTPISTAPWQVALLYAGTPNSYDAQFCGGTIRDQYTIITAAHCVDGYPASTFDVLAGTATLGNGSGQRIRALDVEVHPGYDADTGNNDAALLSLSAPITTSAAAALTPITPSEATAIDAPSDRFLVSGWGSTVGYAPGQTVTPSFPTGLRSVSVPFVYDLSCAGSYGSELITATMLCAGETGKDSCQGDSGGPLAYNLGGSWKLAGIVNSGAGCASAGYPGIYAEVASSSVRGFVTGSVSSGPSPPIEDEAEDEDDQSDDNDDKTKPSINLVKKQCARLTCNLLLSVDDGEDGSGVDSVLATMRSTLKSCAAKSHKTKNACVRKRKLKVRSSEDDDLYTVTATKLKRGRHVITITAEDDAGNTAIKKFTIKSR